MNRNSYILQPKRVNELSFRLGARRRGLSVVVTTLILVVVSAMLACAVAYYATNITMTRTRQEEARITKQRIWANSTGDVAAFKLQNLGGKDFRIEKITVRNVDSPWSNVYYHRVPEGTTFTGVMNITSPAKLTGPSVTIQGRLYAQASTDIPLASGGEILFYVKDLANIRLDDIGIACSIAVVTANGQYAVECMVGYADSQ